MLIQLLNASSMQVVIHDPGLKCQKDDTLQFTLTSNEAMLRLHLNKYSANEVIIFNLGKSTLEGIDTAICIEFSDRKTAAGMNKSIFNYICNKDASMRWIYPTNLKYPHFLSFYNFNYWKANIYKFLVTTAYFLKLTWLIPNGKLFIYSKAPLYWLQILNKDIAPSSYSIFTGTPGPNRKVVIAEAIGKRVTNFIKLAVTSRSAKNIIHEAEMLNSLTNFSKTIHSIPNVEILNDSCIRLSTVQKTNPEKQQCFSNIHADFLSCLYKTSSGVSHYNEIGISMFVKERIERIGKYPHLATTKYASTILLKLEVLHEKFKKENPVIPVATMHGDFTPWNCILSGKELSVYDWELAAVEHPILFDLFHYVIQSQVFTKNADCQQIEIALKEALELSGSLSLISHYKIDIAQHFQLYLLLNASYYLDLYLEQQNLHKEAFLLFKVWNYFLSQEQGANDSQQLRNNFIREFFLFLAPHEYSVLKNAGKPIASLSYESDIDILIKKSDKEEILKWIYTYSDIQKIKCIKKSFMTTVQIFFLDTSFLSVDLLHDFHRKDICYINKNILLSGIVKENGIKILPPAYDYLYIFLFYQINNSSVPEKYTGHFKNLMEADEKMILDTLKTNSGITAKRLEETFAFTPEIKNQIIAHLKTLSSNGPIKRLFRFFEYQMNVLKDLLRNEGFVLTFSGVDGAGKSTILFEVKEMLQKKYRMKVVIIRHRPSLLPIISAWKYGKEEADKRCVESLPRQGKNKNVLSSLARFAYYYSDYLLGQVIIYFKYTLRGYVVLYDRYYFDFIVDSKRSNISLNKGVIKKLYRFVFKPQLNIFLYAKPEIILQRKKELSASDITSLTSEYKHLFNELGTPPQYMCIENIEKAKTIFKIEHAVIQLQ